MHLFVVLYVLKGLLHRLSVCELVRNKSLDTRIDVIFLANCYVYKLHDLHVFKVESRIFLFKLELSMLINYYPFRLLTPPGTPRFPSLEMETQKTVKSQLDAPTTRPTALTSRVSNFSGSFCITSIISW